MRNIIIIGMHSFGVGISHAISQHTLGDIVIVESLEDIKEIKEDVKKSPFEREPITYILNELPNFEYTVTKKEVENYHPFAKFIGKPKGRKRY